MRASILTVFDLVNIFYFFFFFCSWKRSVLSTFIVSVFFFSNLFRAPFPCLKSLSPDIDFATFSRDLPGTVLFFFHQVSSIVLSRSFSGPFSSFCSPVTGSTSPQVNLFFACATFAWRVFFFYNHMRSFLHFSFQMSTFTPYRSTPFFTPFKALGLGPEFVLCLSHV